MQPVFGLSLFSSSAKILRWCLIPFVCPSPALSLRRRRAAWAQWWCPTSSPPPCAACPLSQPIPLLPQASPAAPHPQMDHPAFPPKSQCLHPLLLSFVYLSPCLVFQLVFLCCFHYETAYFKRLFLSAQIRSAVCLSDHASLMSTSRYSQAVPCCPVPAIAGRLLWRRTTGLLGRTGKSGVWANPRFYWRDRQTLKRYKLMCTSYFYINVTLFSSLSKIYYAFTKVNV